MAARHESDREDLMAEATALRQRAEFVVDGVPKTIVAGFRDNGYGSLYFGSDPAYHFDSVGRLRRAFVSGDLYRSQGQTLARLNRSRTEQAVELARHDLEPAELEQFLSHAAGRMSDLRAALERGSAMIVRQVPENCDFESKLVDLIQQVLPIKLAPALTKR